jgi:prepilin-type N-terminal cleavage/methylation domain-containing protein
MKRARARIVSAFTLIEMLVVIAIIAVIAGLVVGLAAVAGESGKLKRTESELKMFETLIDSYKSKTGVYPPDHPSNPGVNSLLYELAGATRDVPDSDPIYHTVFGNVQSNVIWMKFGLTGIVNAGEKTARAEDDNRMYPILKNLKPDQIGSVAQDTISLVVPIDSPTGPRPTPWKYLRGANAVHNPESFDLWVEIKVRGQTRIIGNWKN